MVTAATFWILLTMPRKLPCYLALDKETVVFPKYNAIK